MQPGAAGGALAGSGKRQSPANKGATGRGRLGANRGPSWASSGRARCCTAHASGIHLIHFVKSTIKTLTPHTNTSTTDILRNNKSYHASPTNRPRQGSLTAASSVPCLPHHPQTLLPATTTTAAITNRTSAPTPLFNRSIQTNPPRHIPGRILQSLHSPRGLVRPPRRAGLPARLLWLAQA